MMAWDREKDRKAGKTYSIGISVFGLVFAVFWCCAVAYAGVWIMLIFGLGFVALTAYRLVMCIRLSKEEQKPAEPWETAAHEPDFQRDTTGGSENGYCPYCGSAVSESFSYCPKCGRKLS